MKATSPRLLLAYSGFTLALAASAHAQTFTGLAPLPGATSSNAMGISADGRVVVDLSNHAVRWVAAAAPQDLGLLPGGITSQGAAASADGSFITGNADS